MVEIYVLPHGKSCIEHISNVTFIYIYHDHMGRPALNISVM